MIWKYYGIDWLVFLFIVIHLWMLGNKWRTAFIFGMIGSGFGVILGLLISSVALVIMNISFALMHFRAYAKWSNDEETEEALKGSPFGD